MTRRARIAVVGAGWWSTTAHLPGVAQDPRAELVAVVDPDGARAGQAADRFGGQAFTDITEMIETIRPDGVIIATPHSTHFQLAEIALSAGCNVLVEKPLTTTASDAWTLVALAQEHGVILAGGSTYQYAATATAVRDAVRHGIGELVSVNGEFSSTTAGLFATVDPAQSNLDDPGEPHGLTYSDPATGGGQAHTQLSHLLGGLLWASGQQAVEVAALTDNRGLAVDLVDGLVCRLEGGAIAVASSTGTTADGVVPRHRIRFHGTQGMVEWDMLAASAWVHSVGGAITELQNPVHLPAYGQQRVSQVFIESIIDDVPAPATGYAAAAAVALVEALLDAASSHEWRPVAQAPVGLVDPLA